MTSLKYSLTAQQKDNYCLCSVLQAILKTDEIELSQKQIARHLTLAEYGYLANDQKIIKFLKSQGFEYRLFWNHETPFNEPDYILNEMNKHQGIIGINTHVYLLDSFKDPNCYLIDPKSNNYLVRNNCLVDSDDVFEDDDDVVKGDEVIKDKYVAKGKYVVKDIYELVEEMDDGGFFALIKKL